MNIFSLSTEKAVSLDVDHVHMVNLASNNKQINYYHLLRFLHSTTTKLGLLMLDIIILFLKPMKVKYSYVDTINIVNSSSVATHIAMFTHQTKTAITEEHSVLLVFIQVQFSSKVIHHLVHQTD